MTASVSAGACSDREQVTGQLVLSIETDMALPRQVDSVRLEVLYRGSLHFGNTYAVGRDSLLIPATLTLLQGSDRAEPVTIRVIGSKGNKPRTLRETVTTIPADRAASLRMPIQWLCDDHAEPGADGGVVSTCDEGFTCSGGRCVEMIVPEPTLPTYAPEDVFGGGATADEGSCFDTLGCMQSGSTVMPDAECTIPRPKDADAVNVALRVVDDGICDDANESCFVPLDGNSDDGWRAASDRLTLPLAVCDRMASGRVSAVVVSTACTTKTAATPPCGAWSSVSKPAPPLDDGGGVRVGPSLITTATATGTTLCCSLHADATALYTCQCDGSGHVDVVSVGANASPVKQVGFEVDEQRAFIPSALADDTLFWLDRAASGHSSVRATSLRSGETSELADVDADIFDDSPLLVDEQSLYALASRVADEGDAVQLVAIDRGSGEARSLAVGAKSALQFTQDEQALYVISHTDSGEGASSIRQSRIERIRKSDGSKTPIATATLQGADAARGGFVGLSLQGSSVLALSRTPQPDDSDDVQLLAFDSQGRRQVLFEQNVDPGRTKFLILGSNETATLLVRYTLSSSEDDSSLESGTVLIVPRDGSLPLVTAEFVRDAPAAASVPAPAFDRDGLYWVNSSGRLYRLPLSALR